MSRENRVAVEKVCSAPVDYGFHTFEDNGEKGYWMVVFHTRSSALLVNRDNVCHLIARWLVALSEAERGQTSKRACTRICTHLKHPTGDSVRATCF